MRIDISGKPVNPKNAEEVLTEIGKFKGDHSAVCVLAHVVLEDFNLDHGFIDDTLTRNIIEKADEWVAEQLSNCSDDYSRFYRKAELWGEISSLNKFLTWLRWDVPKVTLTEVQDFLLGGE